MSKRSTIVDEFEISYGKIKVSSKPSKSSVRILRFKFGDKEQPIVSSVWTKSVHRTWIFLLVTSQTRSNAFIWAAIMKSRNLPLFSNIHVLCFKALVDSWN